MYAIRSYYVIPEGEPLVEQHGEGDFEFAADRADPVEGNLSLGILIDQKHHHILPGAEPIAQVV